MNTIKVLDKILPPWIYERQIAKIYYFHALAAVIFKGKKSNKFRFNHSNRKFFSYSILQISSKVWAWSLWEGRVFSTSPLGRATVSKILGCAKDNAWLLSFDEVLNFNISILVGIRLQWVSNSVCSNGSAMSLQAYLMRSEAPKYYSAKRPFKIIWFKHAIFEVFGWILRTVMDNWIQQHEWTI
jgi:hypothetical protein